MVSRTANLDILTVVDPRGIGNWSDVSARAIRALTLSRGMMISAPYRAQHPHGDSLMQHEVSHIYSHDNAPT